VAQGLGMVDEVDARRLAHLGELREVGDARALIPDVLSDRPVRGAEVGEAALRESLTHQLVYRECRVAQEDAEVRGTGPLSTGAGAQRKSGHLTSEADS